MLLPKIDFLIPYKSGEEKKIVREFPAVKVSFAECDF